MAICCPTHTPRYTILAQPQRSKFSMPKKNPFDLGKLSGAATFFVTFVGLCIAAVTWGVNTATKAEVAHDIATHSRFPHHVEGKAISAPASIVPMVEANTRAIVALKKSNKSLHEKADEQKQRALLTNARLEFLIEIEMHEAEGSPSKRTAVRRAARRVRARSAVRPGSSDPFSDLDGL